MNSTDELSGLAGKKKQSLGKRNYGTESSSVELNKKIQQTKEDMEDFFREVEKASKTVIKQINTHNAVENSTSTSIPY